MAHRTFDSYSSGFAPCICDAVMCIAVHINRVNTFPWNMFPVEVICLLIVYLEKKIKTKSKKKSKKRKKNLKMSKSAYLHAKSA